MTCNKHWRCLFHYLYSGFALLLRWSSVPMHFWVHFAQEKQSSSVSLDNCAHSESNLHSHSQEMPKPKPINAVRNVLFRHLRTKMEKWHTYRVWGPTCKSLAASLCICTNTMERPFPPQILSCFLIVSPFLSQGGNTEWDHDLSTPHINIIYFLTH